MASVGYKVTTSAAVALAAATAKSILGIKAPTGNGMDLIGASVQFDGASGSAVPVLVELCYCTFATNPPGTNSTSRTPVQAYGRVIAAGATAASNWTAEPTAITVLDEFLFHPQAGVVLQLPLGTTYDCAVSEGFLIRCTAPAIVNARATLHWERC
jgi:hypothetical protein